jgi:hypothetical protein
LTPVNPASVALLLTRMIIPGEPNFDRPYAHRHGQHHDAALSERVRRIPVASGLS